MSNYYTVACANDTFPCTASEAKELNDLLAEPLADEEAEKSGMRVEYDPASKSGYLVTADASANPEALPEKFLKALGKILKRERWPYLEVGVAFTCDSYRPGSHGGDAFRIHHDGTREWAQLLWASDKKTKK